MGRILAICFLLMAELETIMGQCNTTYDPCVLSKNTELPYMSLRSPDAAYVDGSWELDYCDLYAVNSYTWYRSQYGMTTECVEQQACNTHYPIWLNGTLPTSSDGVVDRTTCLRTFDSCCERTYPLKVKECTYYTVYCFEELPTGCPQRFCFDVDLDEVQPFTVVTNPSTEFESDEEEEEDDDDSKCRHHSPKIVVLSIICVMAIVVTIILIAVVLAQRKKIANLVKPEKTFANVIEIGQPHSGKSSPPPPYDEFRKH